MRIGIVRHGQTDANSEGCMQGKLNTPLNDKGRLQCKMIKSDIREGSYDVCFSSPLLRTFETAMILVGDEMIILKDDCLIERDLGEFDGKQYDTYDADKYWDYHLNCNDKKVESVQSLFERAEDFIKYLEKDFSDKNVLIVTHGAMVKALHHILNKTNFEKEKLNMIIKNCHYEFFEN